MHIKAYVRETSRRAKGPKLALSETQNATSLAEGDPISTPSRPKIAPSFVNAPTPGAPLNPFFPRSPWTGRAGPPPPGPIPFPLGTQAGYSQLPQHQNPFSAPPNPFPLAAHQHLSRHEPPHSNRIQNDEYTLSAVQQQLFKNDVTELPRLSVQDSTPASTVISFFNQVRSIQANYRLSEDDTCSLLASRLAKDTVTEPWLNKLRYSGGYPTSVGEWERAIGKKCHLTSSIQAASSELYNLRQGSTPYKEYYTKYIRAMHNSFVEDSIERGVHFYNSLAEKEMTMLQTDHRWFSLVQSPALSVDACHDILAELLQAEG
jgi:hypothetical protein